MCGIAGIVDHGGRIGPERLARIARAMADALVHRGPDDGDVWVDPSGLCALSHRRLSIIDTRAVGRQPMVGPGGRSVITYNGEIYNYRELRPELERRGEPFHTETDTEVLLRLLDSPDPERLAALRGMYAFATWYPETRTLFLARDAFGKKPLYLARGDGWLAFASELGAIARIPDLDLQVSRDAVAEYLLLQYVPAPRAIYEGCEKLAPGSWARFTFAPEGVRREDGRHFEFHARGRPLGDGRTPDDSEVDARADELLPHLIEAVSLRMRSDVPLGAFLSGGIDSGLVVAMMRRELGVPVQSFSIGFRNSPESEHEAARESAQALGTEHHEEILAPDAVQLLPEIAAHLDEPLGDSSCLPTWLISRFARRRVTVVLSGDGGDELFGGYPRYEIVHRARPGRLKSLLTRVGVGSRFRPGDVYCTTIFLMFGADDVRGLMGDAAGDLVDARVGAWVDALDDESRPLIHRLRELDARTYMPGAVLTKVDRMSMAFALEVRSPFLDARIADYSSRLEPEFCYSAGTAKRILRRLSSRYMSRAHVTRPKLGFGLPGASWSRADMLAMMEEALLGADSRVSGFLDMDGLRRYVARCRSGKSFSVFQVWTLLMLEHWLRSREVKPAHAPSI